MQRTGTPKKVIVIGAGLAGLSAAYELTEAGHDVTVLEAQTRPGGRVLTLREPFSDDLYAEMGASHFNDTHDYTLRYARLFDLPLQPESWRGDLARVIYRRGNRITGRDRELEFFDVTPEEKKLGRWGMWEKYVKPALDEVGRNPAGPGWSIGSLKKYDEMSYTEFLRSQGASPEATTLLGLWWWGDGPETVSALAVLRDREHEFRGESWFRIEGGSDLLPRAFARRLSERILYGAPVVRIEQDAEGVRAVFQQAGRHHTLAAERLICAIPFSVLRRVEVSPLFSPEKQRAIERLPYFSAARVSVQCRRRFWLQEGLNGWADTDLPITSVGHATYFQPGPRGILQSNMAGPDVRRLLPMSEVERIEFTLDQMEKLFPGVRDYYEGAISKVWDEDEWARGASSWYRPGQMSELWPHIPQPEGRVHFAGDHTSAWIRWMQGALESGNRTAREVNEAT